jgi:hypothetical protein
MTDTTRCEPPEHLRGVDGWHWIRTRSGEALPRFFRASTDNGIEPLWLHQSVTATPAWAFRHWDWCYIAPVAPPDVVRELVEALVECADDLEAEVAARYNGIRHYPTMAADEKRDMEPVAKARATLARAKEAGV